MLVFVCCAADFVSHWRKATLDSVKEPTEVFVMA